MDAIDSMTIRHQEAERQVTFMVGDLASLPESEAVDVLVVSAFPDHYAPTPGTLIGALDLAGISVEQLARNKEIDLRAFSSCWLSQSIEQPGASFRRILCFEPATRGRASEVVGDVFRSIVPLASGDPPMNQVAMPLLASGHQGESAEVMLEALAEASVQWLSAGLPLKHIKIVAADSSDVPRLSETFARVKKRHADEAAESDGEQFQFDVFLSYAHKDRQTVDVLVRELMGRRPGLRIFMDRMELQTGAAWQQDIFESLDQSRRIICALSPNYLASKVCKEEFNIAFLRHREAAEGVLLPVYLRSTELPTYMKLIQYEDARDTSPASVARTARSLLRQL